MSSNLIVLPKQAEAVKPKLKRSEIVRVMAHRILVKVVKERNAARIKLAAQREAIEKKILAVQKAMPKAKAHVVINDRQESHPHGYSKPAVKGNSNGISVTYTYAVLPLIPPDLNTEINRYLDAVEKHKETYNHDGIMHLDSADEAMTPGWRTKKRAALVWAENEARAMLGEVKAPTDRVPALLSDPAMVKAFDGLITKLENAESDKKAIAV